MSVSETAAFEISDLPLDPIEDGTSILLTGDDADALETVFYRFVSARDDERSLVLATDANGSAVNRALDDAADGASERSTVLTCEGPDAGSNVTTVGDITDLTGLGMQFSSLVAESESQAPRFRAGILLCSSICREIEDTRSVFRFLNSNLLSPLRRNEAVGVCALDTSVEVGTDTGSLVAGMKTSFAASVEVERTGPDSATLHVSGLGDDRSIDVSL
ncbi:DUF7504 family protein [Halorussus caseinilyticus]|uniref:Uncharacterized protein n=1 Tax=Halorussus caseinilyticus TaxID=3034025 RepID=A0ABD5WNX4_9EURY|nr:hypothetical protein [Halorussus sp. DT72]